MIATFSLAAGFLLASPPGDLLAIRVGQALTGADGTIEHAVILVEDGKIVAIGEDLPIERGIPVLDRPDWVAMPGLVNPHSRIGLDSTGDGSFSPEVHVSRELYARQDVYAEVLRAGVTTIGLFPVGTSIPGQAVAIRPHGETKNEMVLEDGVYLKIHLLSNSKSKKTLREAFEKVAEHREKVEKAREKWEKDEEKKKKKSKSKKDEQDQENDKKDDDKKSDDEKEKEDEGPTEFVPPEPDPKVKPFIDLLEKRLSALMQISKAGDYLHLLDVIEDEKIDWFLRVPLRNDIDLYEVKERIGERELVVVVEPLTTLQPNTRRIRNLPAELDAAGAHVAFVPRSDDLRGHEQWVKNVGELLRDGLSRDAAVAALTSNAAKVLGLEGRLGSLEVGKDANIVFWNGDPFQPGTEIQAVMLEGDLVHEEDDE